MGLSSSTTLIFTPNQCDFDLYFQFQVAKLFSKIQEMVEEENSLVFVLIGENFDNRYFQSTLKKFDTYKPYDFQTNL